jgi:hypothetical protein
VGEWGKGIEALSLLAARQSQGGYGKAYNGRMNTQTEALITRRETTPFDRYDVTDSPQRIIIINQCDLHNTSAVNSANHIKIADVIIHCQFISAISKD